MKLNKGQVIEYISKIYFATSVFFALWFLNKELVDGFTFYRLLLSLLIALFSLPNYLVFRKHSNSNDIAFALFISKVALIINILLSSGLILLIERGHEDYFRLFLHLMICYVFLYSSYLITIERSDKYSDRKILNFSECLIYLLLLATAYAVMMFKIPHAQEFSMLAIAFIGLIAGRYALFNKNGRKNSNSKKIQIKIAVKSYIKNYISLQMEVVFGFGSIFLTYIIYRKLNGINGVGVINSIHSAILFAASLYYTYLIYGDELSGRKKLSKFQLLILKIFDLKYLKYYLLLIVGFVNFAIAKNFAIEHNEKLNAIKIAAMLLFVMLWQVKIGVQYKLFEKNKEALMHNIGVFTLSVTGIVIFPVSIGAVSLLYVFLASNFIILIWMIFDLEEFNKNTKKIALFELVEFISILSILELLSLI